MQFNIDLVYSISTSTLRSSVPLILASMGNCLSMRADVSDLGLEGMMLAGSFFAVLGSWTSGNTQIGLLTGILFDAVFSMLYAAMHISYKVNASISGICVNLLTSTVTPLLLNAIFGMNGRSTGMAAFTKPNWDILQKIPMISRILGAQSVLFFLTILLAVISWIFLYKTILGLRMRMISENPRAASTAGLNVRIYKCFGVAMSGAFTGLGGTYLSLGWMSLFVESMTSRRGYITVVINALGRYSPVGALGSSLFFGFLDSLQTIFQNILPSQLVMMTPYVFTLLITTFELKGSKAPAGVGKHAET